MQTGSAVLAYSLLQEILEETADLYIKQTNQWFQEKGNSVKFQRLGSTKIKPKHLREINVVIVFTQIGCQQTGMGIIFRQVKDFKNFFENIVPRNAFWCE